jgi:hypothetical protein
MKQNVSKNTPTAVYADFTNLEIEVKLKLGFKMQALPRKNR